RTMWQDLRAAMRMLLVHRGFALVSILTLATRHRRQRGDLLSWLLVTPFREWLVGDMRAIIDRRVRSDARAHHASTRRTCCWRGLPHASASLRYGAPSARHRFN